MKKNFKLYCIKEGADSSPLRRWRISHNLHACDVARSLGVCAATISLYERRIETPSPRVMKKIVLLSRGAVTFEDLMP
jgi:predicted transcriptional regulator